MKTFVEVCEVFTAIQGESTYAGLPCYFIRLSGCNLRCRYCDTVYAYDDGRSVLIDDLISSCKRSWGSIVEVTGGEPLMQSGCRDLLSGLRDKTGKKILVETNGSFDISVVPDDVIAVMDVKCPDSGENEKMDLDNLGRLRSYDEVKFVISGRSDYNWARNFVEKYKLSDICNAVLFSPVSERMAPKDLGEWIIEDELSVRLQLQLHRLIGGK